MALNSKDIVDKALEYIQDNTTSMRARFLSWMNQVVQNVATKDWTFLEVYSGDLTITDSKITLPTDYKDFINLQIGDDYFISKNDVQTDEEKWLSYGEDGTTSMLLPVTTGTAILKYKKSLSTYADNVATVFPDNFLNLFIAGILSRYYLFDSDDRAALSTQLYAQEVSDLYKEDNRKRPMPKRNIHGYIRDRV